MKKLGNFEERKPEKPRFRRGIQIFSNIPKNLALIFALAGYSCKPQPLPFSLLKS
jgi:hypothetical protein